MKYLLDTHTLLWWLLDIPKLTKAQKKILDSIDEEKAKACISVITLWEIAMLYSLGRIHVDFSFRDWLRSLFYHSKLEIIPLDADIILESTALRDTLPGDPADQIIVASAKVLNLSLISSDQKIRSESGIPVI